MSKSKSIISIFTIPMLITLVFVVLKLVGVISWSWILVLCPVWIALVFIALVIFTGLAVLVAIRDILDI